MFIFAHELYVSVQVWILENLTGSQKSLALPFIKDVTLPSDLTSLYCVLICKKRTNNSTCLLEL